ncbi:hypothetical protein KJ912_03640, partial [Patescibacteria group bacterium]|nr:hypothetical protein [Patescibacteria group bacterium]
RSALLTGYIREKVQDYREIHPGFKMGLGLVFTLIALVCLVLGVENYSLIQAVVLTLGIMISFEGFWQEYSIRKGIRLNLTRAQALRKARRAVGSGTKDLEPRFRRIHQELEKDIWQIRRFEKRAEYKRYVFAVFGGAFLGALIAWPHGTDLMIETFFLAGFSHLFLYLILPFGLIGVFIIERENEYYARDAYQKEDEALKSVCKSCML